VPGRGRVSELMAGVDAGSVHRVAPAEEAAQP
jgi:hypothetical protein